MRCSKCGRLPKDETRWEFPCQCGEAVLTEAPKAKVSHPCVACDADKHMDCLFGSGMPKCALLTAWLTTVPMDEMVAAVRSDKVVGKGTCSRIDECLEDDDLKRELALAGCATPAGAVKWARADEKLFMDEGLNQRWGEDDDSQLLMHHEFEAADKANPVE